MPVSAVSVAREYWRWVDDHKNKPPRQDTPEFAERFFLSVSQFKARLGELRTDGFVWPPARPE